MWEIKGPEWKSILQVDVPSALSMVMRWLMANHYGAPRLCFQASNEESDLEHSRWSLCV